MKWKKFRIKTVTDAEDIIISTLYDIGLEGSADRRQDPPLTAAEKEQMFVDILPEGPADDGIAWLSFFVEENEDGKLLVNGEETTQEAVLDSVRTELDGLRAFCDIGEGSISVDETEDIDWINNWKQYFHQFYIDDLLVIPSWEEVKEEDRDKMILHIDPGTAFGTGMHETTPAVHPPAEKICDARYGSCWMWEREAAFSGSLPSCSARSGWWERIWIPARWTRCRIICRQTASIRPGLR